MLGLLIPLLVFVVLNAFGVRFIFFVDGEVHVSPCEQHQVFVRWAPGPRTRSKIAYPVRHRVFFLERDAQHDIARHPEITWEGNRVRLTGAFIPYHHIEF